MDKGLIEVIIAGQSLLTRYREQIDTVPDARERQELNVDCSVEPQRTICRMKNETVLMRGDTEG